MRCNRIHRASCGGAEPEARPWVPRPLRLLRGRHELGVRLKAEAPAPNAGKPQGPASSQGPHPETQVHACASSRTLGPEGEQRRKLLALRGSSGPRLIRAVAHQGRGSSGPWHTSIPAGVSRTLPSTAVSNSKNRQLGLLLGAVSALPHLIPAFAEVWGLDEKWNPML